MKNFTEFMKTIYVGSLHLMALACGNLIFGGIAMTVMSLLGSIPIEPWVGLATLAGASYGALTSLLLISLLKEKWNYLDI